MQRLELLDRTTPLLVRNEMSKLPEHVSADLDHRLVHLCRLKVLENGGSGVGLEILVIGDKLDDAVPNFGADVVASGRDELKDGIDIPLVLSYQLLPDRIDSSSSPRSRIAPSR